jgi:small-conductance mechanosensitive channel
MQQSLKRILLDPAVSRLVAVLVGLVVIVAIVRLLQRSAVGRIQDADTRYRARKVLACGGYVAAVAVILVVYSNRLTGLTVAFGVAGAGIAFALQEVIASVAGWVALSFSRFYAPGDRIQLGGIRGDVIDIGILRTTLMECGQWVDGDLYNGRIVRIANSYVFREPVFNDSGDFPFLWDEITVPIRYGSDRARARRLLEEVVREVTGDYSRTAKQSWSEMVRQYRIEDAQVEPMVTLVATDNWLEFTVRYVVDYRRRRVTKNQVFTRLLEEIDATGGRVALGSATFELVGAPPITVQTAP